MRVFPYINGIGVDSTVQLAHMSSYGSGFIQTDVYSVGDGFGYGFSFGHGYGYGTIGGRGEGNGYLNYPTQLIQYWQ